MDYSVEEMLTATGGTCSSTAGHIRGINKDTRSLSAGNLYVALKGEQFDGHAYVSQALEQGASFALVSEMQGDAPADKQILVPDTLLALQDAARWRRNTIPKVAGITGSVGKTSAKEMLAHCLRTHQRIYATQGNYNNHIGMPLTILNAPLDTEILVLEMGMNHAGEIALLSDIARPDAAMITTIDAVHLEFFDSVTGIAHAKAEMVQGMKAGAPIILPKDSAYFDVLAQDAHAQRIITFGTSSEAQYQLQSCSVSLSGTRAQARLGDASYALHIGAAGQHHAVNAMGVLALCDALGADMQRCINALTDYTEPAGRGVIATIPWQQGHISIIDETYNASPIAVNAALARASALSNGRRVIAVLGDMLELGEASAALHASLATALATHQITEVYCCGHYMQALKEAAPYVHYFVQQDTLIPALINAIKADDIILCKGSRGSKMERVIEGIKSTANTSIAV
jgi:UDP-N-acetylmuramoyl-tripeptide--D-alanyl-D-alanine ligase